MPSLPSQPPHHSILCAATVRWGYVRSPRFLRLVLKVGKAPPPRRNLWYRFWAPSAWRRSAATKRYMVLVAATLQRTSHDRLGPITSKSNRRIRVEIGGNTFVGHGGAGLALSHPIVTERTISHASSSSGSQTILSYHLARSTLRHSQMTSSWSAKYVAPPRLVPPRLA